MRTARLSVVLTLVLTFAAGLSPLHAQTSEITGTTSGGAHYKIVVPDIWNGDLVIWNHGFDLDPPGPVTDVGPLEEVQLLQGYAVAASSYSLSGWALFQSNRDLELLVNKFESVYGRPDRVLVYGASLGGAVTAFALEKADLGNVEGALMFCGAVAGSRNWDAGIDFRLGYDAICANTPTAAIPGGPKGLPRDSNLDSRDVEEALNACTGLHKRPGKRSRKQKKNLSRMKQVAGVPESFLPTVLDYSVFGMADLVWDPKKLNGKIGTGNKLVDYGNTFVDDNIQRVKAKKKQKRKLSRSFSPSGRVGDTKIISLHTDKDGLVIVENATEYASVVPADNLTLAVVIERQPSHCIFMPGEILAAWEALRSWVDGEPQPTAESLQEDCEAFQSALGTPCRIDPDFDLPPMDDRIRPRKP